MPTLGRWLLVRKVAKNFDARMVPLRFQMQ
jgi:hypothetical protein